MKILLHILFIFLLTVITQIGGLVYVISLFVSKKYPAKIKFKTFLIFTVFYLLSTFLIVPFIAPLFGREKVKHTKRIRPTNYMTVLLNRNYVKPKLNFLLQQTEKELEKTAIEIHYLDANFPFFTNFPLLPHLSHHDGKKLDLSLIYEKQNGKISTKQKSNSGYGVFEKPKLKEYNQIETCLKNGHFQYNYAKYFTFGAINKSLIFSKKGTRKLIQSILKNENLSKIFIEPHLKIRMGLKNKKIRYHGCQAVRHDDHIHIQIK